MIASSSLEKRRCQNNLELRLSISFGTGTLELETLDRSKINLFTCRLTTLVVTLAHAYKLILTRS